jgi:tRNA(fMet)-specific endonuclease VapC
LRTIVDEFLARMTILPWDSEAAQYYGQIRATLEHEGQPMGNLDMMIGAHALALGAVLVTNDQAFARIEQLKVEDWTKA